jgi:hypothetical protein
MTSRYSILLGLKYLPSSCLSFVLLWWLWQLTLLLLHTHLDIASSLPVSWWLSWWFISCCFHLTHRLPCFHVHPFSISLVSCPTSGTILLCERLLFSSSKTLLITKLYLKFEVTLQNSIFMLNISNCFQFSIMNNFSDILFLMGLNRFSALFLICGISI